jgi:hypothetical protein
MTRHSNRLIVPGLLLALAACGDSGTNAPTAYDLLVELRWLHVIGDCEVTAGNPGEFVYRIVISRPLIESDIYETPDFPAEAGVHTLGDGANVELFGNNLQLLDVPIDATTAISLVLSAIEYDPSGYDPDMNFRTEIDVLPFNASTPLDRTTSVGATNACRLEVDYTVNWTAS